MSSVGQRAERVSGTQHSALGEPKCAGMCLPSVSTGTQPVLCCAVSTRGSGTQPVLCCAVLLAHGARQEVLGENHETRSADSMAIAAQQK